MKGCAAWVHRGTMVIYLIYTKSLSEHYVPFSIVSFVQYVNENVLVWVYFSLCILHIYRQA